jgi:phage shock protein C
MEKKLYRDEQRKTIGGVCAGLAEYFGVDVSVVRVIFVLALVLKGVGFLPYIVLWIVLPRKQYNYNNPNFNNPAGTQFGQGFTFSNPTVDYTVPPPPQPGEPFGFTPPKKQSNAGMLFGVVLIVLGSIFLLDQFDFIPELDFENLWPVILIAVGGVLIFSGQKKQAWDKEGWQEPVKPEEPLASGAAINSTEWKDAEKKDDQTNNNPPIL